MKRSVMTVTFSLAALVSSGAVLGRCDEVVRHAHTIQPARAAPGHTNKYRTPVIWRTGK